MNILMMSWRDIKHPYAGGAEISTYEHAKGWVKAGHKVTWFSSSFRGGKKTETINGIKFVRYGFQFGGVQFLGCLWYLFSKHEDFDLVVDQFHGIPFFTPLYVKTNKLAFIHEVTKDVWKLNPWKNPYRLIPAYLGPIIEPLIFKLLYKKNTPFITVSNSTKKDLMNWGIASKNITVIENGVEIISTKTKKEHKKTVIFLGAIAKDKGIEDALEVFAKIGKREPSWQFWVVGKSDPDYLTFLKEKAKYLNINNLIFWGFVSDKKKFELLGSAHIFINPSAREGWGLVVTEANSVGLPAVVYNVPGLVDSTKHGVSGIILENNNPKEMAREVIRVVNSPILYNRLSSGARKWASQFSWAKAARESLNVIERITKNGKE